MKRKFHLNYFKISFSQTCKSKPVLMIILVIEQLTLLLETVKSTAIGTNIFYRKGNTTETYKQFNDDYYLNHFSLLFNFRRILPKEDISLYPSYLFIVVIVFLIMYLSMLLIQLMHPHRIITLILVNFYDLLFFRLFSFIILDIIINFASNSEHDIIKIPIVNGVISAIIIIYVVVIYINYYRLIFIYFKYSDRISYRFDFLSVNDNCLMFLTKCLIVLQNNLIYNNYNGMVILFLSFIIFVFAFMSLFSNLYSIKIYPCLVCHNFLYHKLRVSFQICTVLCLSCVLFDIYKNTQFYYISFIASIVFSCLCFYGIEMDFFENMVMNGMDEINHLAKILQVKYMKNEDKKKYIDKILFHVFTCNNCNFCKAFQQTKIDSKSIKKNDEIEKILFIIYKIFLNNYKQKFLNKDNNKSILNDKNVYDFSFIVYDLFYLLTFSFHKNHSTYDFLSYMYYVKKKYIFKNYPVFINLCLIQNKVFQNVNQKTNPEKEELEKDKILVKDLSTYIHFLDKFSQIIQSIQDFISRETKTPKQFLNLGYELQNLKPKDSKQFLLNNKKSSKFNVELLTFLLEEITNEPINKERGFVKHDITLNEDLLNYHFNNNQNIIMLYDAKVNQAYIKKTGKDMIHYLNEELSELFPYELREEGKKQFKSSLNYDSEIKHFEFILYKTKAFKKKDEFPFKHNTYVRFDLQYKLYYESLDNNLVFLVNGEYKFNNDEIVITKTKNTLPNDNNYLFQFKYKYLLNEINNENKDEDISKKIPKGTVLFKLNPKFSVIQNPIKEDNVKESIHAITLNSFNFNKIPKPILYNKINQKKMVKLSDIFSFKGNVLMFKDYFNDYLNTNNNFFHSTRQKKNPNIEQKTKKKHLLQLIHVLTITTEYYVYKVYSSKKNFGEIQKQKVITKRFSRYINVITQDISSSKSKQDEVNLQDGSTFAESNSSINFALINKKDRAYLKIKATEDKYLNQVQSRFISIIKFTFGFCLIIILYNITTLVIELNWNSKLMEIYDVYTELRSLNRIFYNVANSILAVICIAKSPDSPECVNYYKEYNIKFNDFHNITYHTFEYVVNENLLKVATFGTRLTNIRLSIFNLNNKKVIDLMNSEFLYSSLSLADNTIQIFEKNVSFVASLEIFLNSLIIITEDKSYIHQPVYIFSLSTYDFSNLYDKEHLTEAQIAYYNSVLNYAKFLCKWEEIHIILSNYSIEIIKEIKMLVIVFICIGGIFHICLIILVYNFIKNFENLFIINTNQLMKKFDNQIYLKFYNKKYENLSILSKLYEKNPNSLIKELEVAYSDFTKDLIAKKNNETKTENTLNSDSLFNEGNSFNPNNTNDDNFNYFSLKQYRRISIKFFILMFMILFYYILLIIIFLTIWTDQINYIITSFSIITEYTLSAYSGYNLLSLCEIMLLTNQTQKEISLVMNYEGSNYIYDESLKSLENIISIVEQSKKLGGLFKSTSDFLDLDCEKFIYVIKDTRTEQLDKMYPEYKFKELFAPLCKVLAINQYKKELLFYTSVFYEINKLSNMIEIRKEYKDVIYYLENSNIYFICNLEFFLYRQFISWFNGNILKDAINRSMNREQLLLYTILCVSISSEIIIFIILYFQVFRVLKKLNNTLGCVSNAFNVVK